MSPSAPLLLIQSRRLKPWRMDRCRKALLERPGGYQPSNRVQAVEMPDDRYNYPGCGLLHIAVESYPPINRTIFRRAAFASGTKVTSGQQWIMLGPSWYSILTPSATARS